MTAQHDLDRQLNAFLLDGPTRLPDSSFDAVRDRTEQTRQRVVLGPWRVPTMSKLLPIGLGAAAVIAVLFLGSRFIGSPSSNVGGPASQPPASAPPSEAPASTAPASAAPTPRSVPDGDLAPGTYVSHPLSAPNDSLTVTFTVPEGWTSFGNALIPAGDPGTEPPGGIAINFDDVTTLNADPCQWFGTANEMSVGPAVDDLVSALVAQTAYEVSDPVDVTIGGYSGKRVDIVHPTEPFAGETSNAPGCDDGEYRLWGTSVYGEGGIYAQGPANRWQANVLDVDGTRLVIVAQDFPGTSAADRAEMDAIIDSLVIAP